MSLVRRAKPSLPKLLGFAKRSLSSVRFPGESIDSSSHSSLTHGIHVFQCPDSVGIVAKLSDCIASRGGNILIADVFAPEKKNVFYARRNCGCLGEVMAYLTRSLQQHQQFEQQQPSPEAVGDEASASSKGKCRHQFSHLIVKKF